MLPIDEALQLILAQARSFGTEEISIEDALNRVATDQVNADRDYPPFNRATMDGYAVSSADFNTEKQIELKLIATLHAGETAQQKVIHGTCIKIMTGAPVPEGADAVVRFEDCIEKGNTVQFNISSVSVHQNIALQGEDAIQGNYLLWKNAHIDAQAIAVLAVTGKARIEVHTLPRVAIISTGNEVVEVTAPILPHQIRDSNSYALKNFLKQYAIYDADTMLIEDDKEKLKQAISSQLDKDILIISGGVSKGEADYVPEVLMSLGVKEIFHRVRIKPGNPLWFGFLPGGGVVFGLPGNPVSVQVAYKVFIETYLRQCFNMDRIESLYFPMLNPKLKKSKFTEYFPCKLKSRQKFTGLVAKDMNTSGDVSATANTDGIAIHPEHLDTLKENVLVEFYFWNNQ